MGNPSFIVISTDVLPEIFPKVLEVKRLLACGEEKSSASACKRIGISRSAFYKYKDSVQPFNDMKSEHIITFYAMLKDTSGVLSRVLSVFASSGANILTINQSIPSDGVAFVTISAKLDNADITPDELIVRMREADGVVSAELLAG